MTHTWDGLVSCSERKSSHVGRTSDLTSLGESMKWRSQTVRDGVDDQATTGTVGI